MRNAIILCSGGMDSTVTAHLIRRRYKYDRITILFFNYSQKSLQAEKKASKACAKDINSDFIEISIPELGRLSSSLINKPGKISEIKSLKDTREESEKWYVPCRNTIFLSYALALAESEYIKSKAPSDIFVGFKCEGREHYPDTNPEYLRQINVLSGISCARPFRIIAPLIKMDKEDIIRLGLSLNVPLESTFSCYVGNAVHCGKCLACKLRKSGFHWAGLADPTKYSQSS